MLHHLRQCVSPYCYASSQTRNTHFIILFLHHACSDRMCVYRCRYCLFTFFFLNRTYILYVLRMCITQWEWGKGVE